MVRQTAAASLELQLTPHDQLMGSQCDRCFVWVVAVRRVPYSFGPLYNFHLPPAAQAFLALSSAGADALVHGLLPLLLAPASQWAQTLLAVETLGHIGATGGAWRGCDEAQQGAVLAALLNCTQHERWWVRRSAYECAGRLSVCFGESSATMALGRKIIHKGAADQNFLVR